LVRKSSAGANQKGALKNVGEKTNRDAHTNELRSQTRWWGNGGDWFGWRRVGVFPVVYSWNEFFLLVFPSRFPLCVEKSRLKGN